MSEKILKASVDIQVQFYDLDPMDVVWHGNYVKYMETARCALLTKIQYDYTEMVKAGYAWPVVEMNLKYIRPLRFMQMVRVEVSLVEYDVCMKLKYRFIDVETGNVVTKAESTQMAVKISTRESQFATPPDFVAKVKAALEREENA